MGVVRDMSRLSERRLVFDIGGGSTEIVLGVGDQPELLESANMGCVGFSEKFFPKGRLRRENFEKAILRARLEIRPLVPRFALARPDRVLGASGTMRSLGRILEMSGLGAGSLTCEGLQGLRRVFEEHGKLQNVELPGLSAERRPVLPGGLSIAIALCMDFDVDQIEIAQGALREGLLHDMAARWQKSDPREHTIGELVERFRVDEEQGERVAITALRLLELLGAAWDLSGAHYAQWLRWAAELHEVGLGIAHPGYHKHGAYIVAHSDMPGFSRQEQEILSVLIGSHRRTLRPELFARIAPGLQPSVLRLAVLLRIAFLLHRSRDDVERELIDVDVFAGGLRMNFRGDWPKRHALTLADLRREGRKLSRHGIELEVSE
jgi:exopolyphosphatase/guanosine-5'-triphosphate,3'-diphosphate pyrophosphatase